MCTVSFISLKKGICITSNRDEKLLRKPALAPKAYEHNGNIVYYPKDTQANGSWFVCNNKGDCFVLLNGAFNKHIPVPPYAKSRGLVLVEIATAQEAVDYFTNSNLQNIEPFTVIIFQDNRLYECRWNGKEKFCIELPITQAHIWSSATLYTKAIQEKRANWFKQALAKQQLNTSDNILQFHCFTGDTDIENNLVMQRGNIMKTVSITLAHIQETSAQLQYIDLLEQKKSTLAIPFTQDKVL